MAQQPPPLQRAARNGFYWWEVDMTWYAIRAMAASAWCGTLTVPKRIYDEARVVKAKRATRRMSIVDATAGRWSSSKKPTSDYRARRLMICA